MAVGSDRSPVGDINSAVNAALNDYRSDFPEWPPYLDFHRRRYQLLVNLVVKLADSRPSVDRGAPRILVIGPRFEVDLIHRLLPGVAVDSLGLNAGMFPARADERQVIFHLGDVDLPERRPVLGPYQLIVMAEVIEHVSMPPAVVLEWVGSLLSPGGHLIVQTPNAVTLPHRLRMMAGKNPYAQLSTNRAAPGHIREYTTTELVKAGQAAGLEVAELKLANYFTNPKLSNRVFQRLERVVPKTLRAGITIVYRSPG